MAISEEDYNKIYSDLNSNFEYRADEELSDEELLKKYSYLPHKNQKGHYYMSQKQMNENIKAMLNHLFPDCKFSVSNLDKYGNTRISWTDGVKKSIVEKIACKFSAKSWDAYTDNYEYNFDHFRQLFSGGYSVSVEREISLSARNDMRKASDKGMFDEFLEKYGYNKEWFFKKLIEWKSCCPLEEVDLRIKAASKPAPAPAKQETPKQETASSDNGVTISPMWVLVGDTKPIKDTITAKGGKFCGHFGNLDIAAGWIFDNEETAKKLIQLNSSKDLKLIQIGVIHGDTKPIKDEIKIKGGVFNKYLPKVGAGWMFPWINKDLFARYATKSTHKPTSALLIRELELIKG